MKIVHILGRGIEGCGVTRFTLEMKEWALSQGWDYSVYATKDKRWTRANAHDLGAGVYQQKFGNKPARGDSQHGIGNVLEAANSADLVVFGSLPSKSHPEDCIQNFERLIDGITSRIVMIQHDHKMMSIKRNACLDQLIKRADVIFSYSPRSPFMVYCQELGTGANLESFCNGLNLEKLKDQYYKPIDQQDPHLFKWIGRSAYWKGFDVFFDLYDHGKFNEQDSLLYTLEGMEKSIQFVNIREKWDFHEMGEDYSKINELKRGEKPYIFGAYNHAEMLERLSLSAFGFQLTYLQPEYIHHFIEFTHLEIVGVGAIPVFRKTFGDHCTHLQTGNPMTADANTGTIWIGEVGSDHSETVKLIDSLRADPGYRDEFRHMSYEYYTAHNSPDSSFNDFYEKAQRELTHQNVAAGLESFFE